MFIEKIILKELGYELYRICDNHPHKLIPSYLKILRIGNNTNNNTG